MATFHLPLKIVLVQDNAAGHSHEDAYMLRKKELDARRKTRQPRRKPRKFGNQITLQTKDEQQECGRGRCQHSCRWAGCCSSGLSTTDKSNDNKRSSPKRPSRSVSPAPTTVPRRGRVTGDENDAPLYGQSVKVPRRAVSQ
ncbi:expressed unknown protein [Seminavis robusta]|uniref:Uncharacterized protein n=1 Tax=Seminavis robusta TaxID=568900 RepID=A0A9N8DWP2_9STRA|nr:expressed unknown protein [Seminavis robusta]|eukprot:Sro433_g141860.1 n/a (141) ;mRNA; f:43716-44138